MIPSPARIEEIRAALAHEGTFIYRADARDLLAALDRERALADQLAEALERIANNELVTRPIGKPVPVPPQVNIFGHGFGNVIYAERVPPQEIAAEALAAYRKARDDRER